MAKLRQLKCDCCGADLRPGEGHVINASLSKKVAQRLEAKDAERRSDEALNADNVLLLMKQVLACSDRCARRATGRSDELPVTRVAAELWWQAKLDRDPIKQTEDVYITRAMVDQALAAKNSAGDDRQQGRELNAAGWKVVDGNAPAPPPSEPATNSSDDDDEDELPSDMFQLVAPASATGEAPPANKDGRRVCRFLFAIGGGFNPELDAEELLLQFMEDHPKLEYTGVNKECGIIDPWHNASDDELKRMVEEFVGVWLAERYMSFEPNRLIYADYFDEETNQGFLVAGYLPEVGSTSLPQPLASQQPTMPQQPMAMQPPMMQQPAPPQTYPGQPPVQQAMQPGYAQQGFVQQQPPGYGQPAFPQQPQQQPFVQQPSIEPPAFQQQPPIHQPVVQESAQPELPTPASPPSPKPIVPPVPDFDEPVELHELSKKSAPAGDLDATVSIEEDEMRAAQEAASKKKAQRSIPAPKPVEPKDEEPGVDIKPTKGKKPSASARKRQAKNKMLMIASGSGVVLLLSVIGFLLSGPGDDPKPNGNTNVVDESDNDSKEVVVELVDPDDVPLPKIETGEVRVYTSEPGSTILINGEYATDENGDPVKTPCAVILSIGSHTLTLLKDDKPIQTELVSIGKRDDVEELVIDTSSAFAGGESILDAPYFDLEVGKSVELSALNTAGPEVDPYVSADGLSIWFASDRPGAKGIYFASRLSEFHEFDEPRLISRSPDMPGTPSVTADNLYVVYTVPQKARLFAVTRDNPLAEFGAKVPLRFTPKSEPVWRSAQMMESGLVMYWVEELDGEIQTLISKRSDKEQEFEDASPVNLPGLHPCISSDELRQYAFDGEVLRRARRQTPATLFSKLEDLMPLEIENYVASEVHRQYFVTDDEEWLFYCDNPTESGDLHMLRLSKGNGWGRKPTGRKIPPKPKTVVAMTPDPTAKLDKPPERVVDPRSLPLPYTSFLEEFHSYLGDRNYEEAQKVLDAAKADPKLTNEQDLIAWDRENMKAINDFWVDVIDSAKKLEPNASIRLSKLRFEFVSFDGTKIVGKSRTKEVERNINELPATDLTFLVDMFLSKTDTEAQRRIATFLAFDKTAVASGVDNRLERAGDLGKTYKLRLARRALRQAKGELDRENFSQGTDFLAKATSLTPDAQIMAEAATLKESLYKFIKWNPVGRRQWKINGLEYEADAQASANSILMSPGQFLRFELAMEYKITNGSGQGGIFFRYPGEGNIYNSAFKIQFSNDAGFAADAFATGSLFSVEPPKENASKPQGQWNTVRLRVKAEEVELEINGKLVLKTTAVSGEIPIKGHVCLDGDVGGIVYRKMLLTELPE